MVEHEGILSLPGVLIHVGKSMSLDIFIGNFSIRFNEVLGQSHITLGRNVKNVEPIKHNDLVSGLIQEKLKVIWLAVKLDGQRFCPRLEELGSRLIRVVENIWISKGWSQCKMGSSWSCHVDLA
jgi:hypothetical protein